ncbi:MAG: DUF3800 domain-containing protein [Candidatus Methanoplasma sp.]|nr:DUF3800 domain-containing protein [Candidatus Methanoplasma sp.]
MTGLIAIDESGDTGKKGSKFFVMAAVITKRSRNLSSVYKAIPKKDFEVKFYNSTERDRSDIFIKMRDANIAIACICIDKQNQIGVFRYGNDLYKDTLEKLIRHSLELYPQSDLDIKVDSSRFISIEDLTIMVASVSKDLQKNVKSCKKVQSSVDKCVKIADFASGSIWARYERENSLYYNMIKEKISTPVNH